MLQRRPTFRICLSLLAAVGSAAFAQTPTDKLDQLFSQYESKTAPGVSILAVQDGKEIYRRQTGLANVEHAAPIDKNTVFHLASVSKQFTAFAACLLEQEGKLSLEDDVRKYLPELPDYGTKITLRNLATHTSGLRDFFDLSAMVGFTENDVSYQGQVLKLLFQQKNLNFKPGTKFEYGNSSYTLLGEIVSRVSKEPLAEFLKERIFKPLGMNDTLLVDDPEIIVPNRASSYYAPARVLYRRLLGPVNVGSTGVNSTADDLVRWSQNFESPKVGSQRIIARMSEASALGEGYALGQQFKNYRGLKIAYHGGGDAGYRSYLIRVPERKFTLVVLSNSREFFPHDLAYGALDAFLFGGPEKVKPAPTFVQKNLSKFTGDYEIFPGTVVKLTTASGKLYLQYLGDSIKMELPRTGESEFNYPIFNYSKFVFDNSKNFKWRLFDMVYSGRKLTLKAFNASKVNLNEFVGTYYSPELRDEYRLLIIQGKLTAIHRRNEDTTLTPIQHDWFHGDSGFFSKVIPVRSRSGKVTGLKVSTQRALNVLFVRVPARPR